MRGSRWLAFPIVPVVVVVLAFTASGCQTGPSKQTLASAEPVMSPPAEGGTTVVEGTPTPAPRTMTFVDRHPLLYKPRDYYESSGKNKIVKSAAAVVVGVPVGIFTELRQIVVGAPPEERY
jgi:hypothetical protein